MGALVLARRVYETVVLEKDDMMIKVSVADISNGQVKLRFDCPNDIKILRQELHDERKQTEG